MTPSDLTFCQQASAEGATVTVAINNLLIITMDFSFLV